jgi:hypothetical protein
MFKTLKWRPLKNCIRKNVSSQRGSLWTRNLATKPETDGILELKTKSKQDSDPEH